MVTAATFNTQASHRDMRQLLCRNSRAEQANVSAPNADEAYAAQVQAQVKRVVLTPQSPRGTPVAPVTETSTLIGKQDK